MRIILLLLLGNIFINLSAQSIPQYDLSFGNNNFVKTSILDTDESNTVLVQPDKKVILAGHSTLGHIIYGDKFGSLVRYNEDGSLDKSFGINGIFKLEDFNPINSILQEDGKILIGG